jgi:hypothetical protein
MKEALDGCTEQVHLQMYCTAKVLHTVIDISLFDVYF